MKEGLRSSGTRTVLKDEIIGVNLGPKPVNDVDLNSKPANDVHLDSKPVKDVYLGSKQVNDVVACKSLSGVDNGDDNVIDGNKKDNGLDVKNVSSVSKKVNGVVMNNSHSGIDNCDDNVGDGDKKENGLDINNVNSVSKTVNGMITNDVNPGLGNRDDDVVDGNNKMAFDIDLNKVDHELNSSDTISLPVNGEVVREHDGECILVDGNIKKNEIDLVLNEVDGSPDILLDGQSHKKVDVNADPDIDTTIPRKKKGRPPKKRRLKKKIDANVESEVITSVPKNPRKVTSTAKGKVDINAYPDVDIPVQKMKLRRSSKQIRVESNADAIVETAIATSEPRIMFGEIPKKKRNATSFVQRKVGVNADPDIDINVPKKKRGRPAKERVAESNIEVENAAVTRGSGFRSAKSPKKKGKTSTFKENCVVNADHNGNTITAKRKRGRPSKKRKVESTEKRVRVSAGVKKGGDIDYDGEEREIGGDEYDDSKQMECGEDADGSDHGDKHMGKFKIEKGGGGRKRKFVESSVHELDNGLRIKKKISFDGESERVGRILRSRAVTSSAVKSCNKTDVSNMKIIGKKKEENAHFSGRQNKRLKGLRGRPPKVQGKSGALKMIDAEKVKKNNFNKKDAKLLSKKVIKEEISSDGEAKEIILKQTNSKKHEEQGANSMGKGVKKKILKDRITKMLISAGWTVTYRPREGRDYCDSIYVSPRGRGYWSVTLAYRVLKQEVESGKADSRAVSAFVPISQNEWNSLLRITQVGLKTKSNKTKKVKNQSSKVISQKRIPKKKNPEKKDCLKLKHKVSLKRSKLKEKKNKKRLTERSNKKRFTLLVRGSKKGGASNSEDFLLYEGKRSLLSWMIDLGTLSLGVKVKCMNSRKTKILCEGKVTRDGIHCDCCNKTLALADFEIHSGSSPGQPLQTIYLDSKTSLLQCLRDSLCKYGETMSLGFHSVDVDGDDPNDDTCNMCGDGGNLICCDSCPSAIHQKCLNIQKFPSGDWNCNYCVCKFCGMVGETTLDEDQNCSTSVPTLPTCRLCEEKYHPLCVQGKDASHNEPNSPTFCGQKCQEIFRQLELLLGVKHQMEEGYSWTLLQHSEDNLDISSTSGANKVECNAKLAVAWSIMDECFLPIVDKRSGISMIRNVVYSCGSNIRRLNYTGFFIAILERGDEIISAATLRIHGNLLAEMPFIGTRYTYRRQGMCRRLLTAIDKALCSLNVEKLVLPAVSEVHQTWTSVFGFTPLEESHKKEMKCMNIIAFPGVDMLQKPVLKQQLFGVDNLSSPADVKSCGTSGVAEISNVTSQVPSVTSNEPLTSMLVDCQNIVTNDENDSQQEAAFQLHDAYALDEFNKQDNVPSGTCDKSSNENPRLDEQELAKVADITAVSEAVSDSIKCETNAKDIVGCVLNGEVNAINHSRDQHVVNDHSTSTQALVLV